MQDGFLFLPAFAAGNPSVALREGGCSLFRSLRRSSEVAAKPILC